jgi:predicted DNA binding protein
MHAEGFLAQRRSRRVRFRPRELIQVPLGKNTTWQRAKEDFEDLNPEEFISREVDPILDKISAHGMQSLTPREREILQSARSKMEKR